MEFLGSDSSSDEDDEKEMVKVNDNNVKKRKDTAIDVNKNNNNAKRFKPYMETTTTTTTTTTNKKNHIKSLSSLSNNKSNNRSSGSSSSNTNDNNNNNNNSNNNQKKPKSSGISLFHLSSLKYNNSENIYHSSKSILTLDVDKNGHYMIAGGHGCNVEQFELNGLKDNKYKDKLLTPKREVIPEPGTAVWSLKYNNNSTNFAVACISPTPSIYDRVCRKVVSFIRGDPYLADMSKTKGHIAVVTGITWHPREQEVLLTSSLDGSLRTWNLNGKKHFDALICNQVIKARDENGRRVGITSSCYDRTNGNLIAGITSSGGLQIWKTKIGSKYDRPQFCNNEANVNCNGDMSDITFVGDGRHLLTRVNCKDIISDDNTSRTNSNKNGGGNGIIKLWDIRKINKPLKKINCGKSNENKCTFHLIDNTTYLLCPSDSGKDDNIDDGTKIISNNRTEFINIFNMADPKNDHNVGVNVETSSICTLYHKRLNNLFIGECDGTISRVINFAKR